MSNLAGKVALVTGGTSGIGAAVSKLLHEAGAKVAVLSDAPQADLDKEVTSGALDHAVHVDISDAEAVAQAVRGIEAALGPVTLLVNNAAIWAPNPVPESPLSLFDRHIDVNLKGTFYVTQAVLPAMIETGSGAIVFIGSVSGVAGRAGDSAYSASKAAVAMLSRTLAAELGPKGIRINCVCPGAVATPLTANLRTPEGEQAIAALMDGHPSPRRKFFMEPVQIAQLVCFLLDDKSSCVHGAVIPADEGLTATM
ncbi:SDR family NAD(P)-dependent oxidoreductase [Novosphingobium sp. P6W]|uniref:SDR family NAD(P)-dependent oxidoreductase n=1 Tax=Novosphingobium sp. P6W TaxID=1609758 RepID=UPI0005C2A4A3|nr:SDR family oxidoreductase [Novosphingobium sp. P6W]AXB79666.1 SDR family NAD(P)-dependent oxidoreductase [Novosphingobium sp. P6W]KIS34385.1 2,5-dichloro-2,5-cyclohexadiene-1,4-diol dehydrogenase [Novosphingobium sp. P6W]